MREFGKIRENKSKDLEEGRFGYEGISYGGEIYNTGKKSLQEEMIDSAEEIRRMLSSLDFETEKNLAEAELEKVLNLCNNNMKLLYDLIEAKGMDLEVAKKNLDIYNQVKSYAENTLDKFSMIELSDQEFKLLHQQFSDMKKKLTAQNLSFNKKISKIIFSNEQGMNNVVR